MEIVVFTIVAALLYLFSDWLLKYLEGRRGAVFANRNLIFFAFIMILALVTFELLPRVL